MKRISILLCASLCIISLAAPVNAAAPKAGTSCLKRGVVQSASGTSFICQKSGNKLIWIKNSILKVANKGTSNSVSGGFPKEKIWPKEMDACQAGSPWQIGLDQGANLVYLSCGPDGMLHPQDGAPKIDQKTGEPIKINHPATLSDFINTSNSDFTNLTEKGWQEFLSLPTSAYSQPIFYVDPKLDPAIASAIRKGAERTLKVFTPYFQYHFPIYEILSTTADFENQSINNDPVLNLLKNQSNFILSTQKESFLRAASTGNQMATGSVIYENGKIVADAIVFRIPKSARENLTLDAAGSHETMHAVQYLTMTNFFLSPMWFNEGQATQIGDIFAMDNEKMTDVAKVMRLFSYPTGSNDLSKFENDDEWNCCDQLAYSRSMAATTYLTGKYGWPKVLKFMVGIGENGQSWQQSFQSAFGESYLDFYSEVKSYLDWLTPSQK